MIQDHGINSNSISGFGEAASWRNRDPRERDFVNVLSPSQAQTTSPKNLPPSAFKVYGRVLEKHRYIPRKWTQDDFEAALPERFKDKLTISNCNSEVVCQDAPEFDNVYTTDEFDFHKEKDDVLALRENAHRASSANPRKKAEMKQKIKNLKAIFEKAGNSNIYSETNVSFDQLKDFQVESKCGTSETDRKEIEELERCKNSEAKVKLIEEDISVENLNEVDGNAEIVSEDLENQGPKICSNGYSSFLNACLRCLLTIEPFVEMLSKVTLTAENNSSPIIVKLNKLMQSIENADEFSKLVCEDEFSELYERISECKNCDEVLAKFLETLSHEIKQATGEDQDALRTLIHGTFRHIKSCDRCRSITNEWEQFLFLNPTIPVVNSPNNSVLDINFLSCDAEGVWGTTTRQFCINPGTMVVDLKKKLLRYQEFYTSDCDSDSIRIGEVNGSRLVKTFEDTDELASTHIRSTSRLFAFHVLDFQSDAPENFNALSNTAISYHLYFNCGLCLSSGREVSLFIHKNCGGMVCRDCLDVITQSYQDWEPCPCPICEQPIDLDKELCKARMSAGAPKKLHPIESSHLCEVIFRAYRPTDGGIELFGCPLIVSLPEQVTGNHLYRCIGYLLPNALPMKDRTSFTLHKVTQSGLRCSTCSLDSCHGCLVRIDENVRVTPNTTLVVHFDDLAEESKKSFGIWDPHIPPTSHSQGLFDGILQSCVRASTSESACSECHYACKVTSSIAEFPQLLLIHLNQLYADIGLPLNTTVEDVSRFLVLQHGNDSIENTKDNLTYQLTAVVLAVHSSATPSYKAYIPVHADGPWMLYEELQASETSPFEQQLTKNSVLFYQPLKVSSSDLPSVGHVLRMPSLGDCREEDKLNGTCHTGYNIYGRKLATISEETATISHPKPPAEFKKPTRKKRSSRRQKIHDTLEPYECFVGTSLGMHTRRGLPKPDIHSSQLSLGEISHDDIAAHMSVDLDGISPISAQEIRKSESRLVRETKKLIRAVKREDAYGIVCSLKRGANPCLLVDDVSALHFAAGTKSDQRCSMIAYLLKYAKDVNIATGDGTTPLHVAAAWGHQDALELLLAHGGDAFNITDQEGNSAFDLASKDCSSLLQLLCQTDGNSPGPSQPSTSSRKSLPNHGVTKARRLEDVVRSNVTLPSFVNEEDSSRSRFRLRWLKPFRSLRKKSSGVLRRLKRMSSVRRRSRIGVMVEDTQEQNNSEKL